MDAWRLLREPSRHRSHDDSRGRRWTFWSMSSPPHVANGRADGGPANDDAIPPWSLKEGQMCPRATPLPVCKPPSPLKVQAATDRRNNSSVSLSGISWCGIYPGRGGHHRFGGWGSEYGGHRGVDFVYVRIYSFTSCEEGIGLGGESPLVPVVMGCGAMAA